MSSAATEPSTDPFAGLQEVKPQWIKWGKPGDWIRGTLTDVREMESSFADRAGEKVKIYEFMATGGMFHNFEKINGVVKYDDKPTQIEPGSLWSIGGKSGIDNGMRNVKIGQTFGMRFKEEKPNKNKSFSPAKVITVLAGPMDENYQGQTTADLF